MLTSFQWLSNEIYSHMAVAFHHRFEPRRQIQMSSIRFDRAVQADHRGLV